jgi:hypothetical protein
MRPDPMLKDLNVVHARLTILLFALLIIPISGMGVLALDYSTDVMVSDL